MTAGAKRPVWKPSSTRPNRPHGHIQQPKPPAAHRSGGFASCSCRSRKQAECLCRSRKQASPAHICWSNSLSAFGGPFSDPEHLLNPTSSQIVILGLVPRIHATPKWTLGTSPRVTTLMQEKVYRSFSTGERPERSEESSSTSKHAQPQGCLRERNKPNHKLFDHKNSTQSFTGIGLKLNAGPTSSSL